MTTDLQKMIYWCWIRFSCKPGLGYFLVLLKLSLYFCTKITQKMTKHSLVLKHEGENKTITDVAI